MRHQLIHYGTCRAEELTPMSNTGSVRAHHRLLADSTAQSGLNVCPGPYCPVRRTGTYFGGGTLYPQFLLSVGPMRCADNFVKMPKTNL